MITWTPVAGLALTVTKPAATNLSISATTDTVGSIINHYTIDSIDPLMPSSIVISVNGLLGIVVSGTSIGSFGNTKQMDYANPDGSLGTATRIVDIPKTSALYNFHVNPTVSQTYSFSVSAYEGTGVYNPATDLPHQVTYQIKVFNSWDGNKTDILNILARNY